MKAEGKKRLTPRDIASNQKKDHIFQTSMKLFKEYGYKNVTMKMIATETGISEGSIYNFFGEKAGIINMLSEKIQRELQSLITPSEEHLNDVKGTIYAFMLAQSDAYESYGKDIIEVHLTSYANRRSVRRSGGTLGTFIDSVYEMEPSLVEFLNIASERNLLKCDISTNEFSFILTSFACGMLNLWISYGDGFSLHDTAEKLFHHVIEAHIL